MCVLLCGSCSDANLRLTHEQLRICNYNTSPGEVVKIVAFAGMILSNNVLVLIGNCIPGQHRA